MGSTIKGGVHLDRSTVQEYLPLFVLSLSKHTPLRQAQGERTTCLSFQKCNIVKRLIKTYLGSGQHWLIEA